MGFFSKILLELSFFRRLCISILSSYWSKCCHKFLFLGQNEQIIAASLYPHLQRKSEPFPFVIDDSFWYKIFDPLLFNSNYFLFVGNDRHRNWKILSSIIQSMPHKNFVIVSRYKFSNEIRSLPNVTFFPSSISNSYLRLLYSNAIATILPIVHSYQPSGQSVALQSLACQTPVLISNFSGIWFDPTLFTDLFYLIDDKCVTSNTWINALEQYGGKRDITYTPPSYSLVYSDFWQSQLD